MQGLAEGQCGEAFSISVTCAPNVTAAQTQVGNNKANDIQNKELHGYIIHPLPPCCNLEAPHQFDRFALGAIQTIEPLNQAQLTSSELCSSPAST